jgi:hypothetical protein
MNMMDILTWVLVIIYVISPIDLVPGPIDDAFIVLLRTLMSRPKNEKG